MAINSTTGEDTRVAVYEDAQIQGTSALEIWANKNNSTGLPIQVFLLEQRTDLSKMSKLRMLTSYTGAPSKTVKACDGEIHTIIGATIIEHGPFNPAGGGDMKPGYFKMLLKTDEIIKKRIIVNDQMVTVEQNLIISCGATQVCDFILSLMQGGNTYDWVDGGIPLLFSLDKDSGAVTCMVYYDEHAEQSTVVIDEDRTYGKNIVHDPKNKTVRYRRPGERDEQATFDNMRDGSELDVEE